MRIVSSTILLIALCGYTAAGDDKPSIGERFTAAQKEYQEASQSLIKQIQASKDAKERNELNTKKAALTRKYAEQCLEIAAADPKNAEAFDPLLAAIRANPIATKAADLMVENHVSNPKIKAVVPAFANMGPAGQKLLKTIAEKSSDKGAKGTALYFLGAAMVENADYPRSGLPLGAEKQAAELKEAESMLLQASKEFGDIDVQIGPGPATTIHKAAEGQLFFLNNLTVGKLMPDSAVQDLDGKKVKISDLRGKVVVLDIWATWCPPCRAMIPHERELVSRMKEKPFVLISLSADAKKETLTQFLVKEPMPWTHWWNGGASGAALQDYHIRFYPTIYVLDQKGIIRFKHVRGDAMDKAVEALLKDAN